MEPEGSRSGEPDSIRSTWRLRWPTEPVQYGQGDHTAIGCRHPLPEPKEGSLRTIFARAEMVRHGRATQPYDV